MTLPFEFTNSPLIALAVEAEAEVVAERDEGRIVIAQLEAAAEGCRPARTGTGYGASGGRMATPRGMTRVRPGMASGMGFACSRAGMLTMKRVAMSSRLSPGCTT